MFESLLTEQVNPASVGIDARPVEEILRLIHEEDRKAVSSVGPEIQHIAAAVEVIAGRLEQGGRLFYIGAGTSGRLGVLDAAECRPTFQVPPEMVQGIIAGGEKALARATETSEDDPEAGARDIRQRGLTGGDVLVGIAASGRTPYVLGAVDEARRTGAATIGISCTPDSELSRRVEIAITPLAGPEIIAGSTRMKAGTATKLVLNMLSTAAMIRLGFVYGNLMVNVQPVNEKLRDRALRVVARASGVEMAAAARLLEEAGDSVRVAILMALLNHGRNEAEALLAAARGRVSAALEQASRG